NTVAMTSEVGSLADSLLVTQLDAGNYYLTVASDGSRDTGSYYVDIYANGALGSGEDGGFGDFDSPGEDWNDDFTDDDWFAGDDEDGAWDSFLPNGRAHNCDVNQDDAVTALDALLVVNALNSPVSRSVAGIDLDVNSDGALTPLDALLVMNNLNSAEAVSRSIVSQSQQISARSRISEQVPAIQSRASSESENSRDRRDQLFAEQVDWLYEDSLT
ncbi:MAG: dockerin type I domain-containing protein, partial [Planctomycetota bacterium]